MGKNTSHNLKEEELVEKISLLKNVKPREEWVILARTEILSHGVGHEIGVFQLFSLLFKISKNFQKPIFLLPVLVFAVFISILFQASQSSLPGDPLYAIRDFSERTRFLFSQEDETAFAHLELAQRRLEDLKRAAENNKVKNLPSTIKEFEKNAAETSKSFAKLVENQPERALQATKEIVKLQEERQAVEQILGIKISEKESEELDTLTRELIENELQDLKTRSLNEEQLLLLNEAQEALEKGNYSVALEKIFLISNNHSF